MRTVGICLTLLTASCVDTDGTVFAVFNVLEDGLTGELRGEIYPVCIYADGIYSDASMRVRWEPGDPFFPDIRDEQQAIKASVLKGVRSFSVYFGPQQVAEFQVNELLIAQYYHCSELVVGRGIPNIIHESGPHLDTVPSERHRGSYPIGRNSEGRYIREDFDYLVWPFAALNSDTSRNVEDILPHTLAVDSSLLSPMLQLVDDAYLQAGLENQYLDSIEVVEFKSFDLDRDGIAEHLLITEVPWRNKTIGGWDRWTRLTWFRIVDGKVSVIEIPPKEMGTREWFWALTDQPIFLLDISGDGIPELILKTVGWEGSRFSVYEFQEGRFVQVFQGAVAGC